jgi:hypothetical protein
MIKLGSTPYSVSEMMLTQYDMKITSVGGIPAFSESFKRATYMNEDLEKFKGVSFGKEESSRGRL